MAASAAPYFRPFGEAGIWLIAWGSIIMLMLDNRMLRREVERLRDEQGASARALQFPERGRAGACNAAVADVRGRRP
jgi:hypothetical protein